MITKDSSFDKSKYLLENFPKALEEEWLEVYYQPIVRAVNGRVCEEEALVRWDDPIMGVLNPGEFVPILEAVNAIATLDLYVLDHVLEKMKKQKEMGLYLVTTSINISQIDFFACDIVEEFVKRVKAAGIEFGKIAIEIAESAIYRNNEQVLSQLERFQEIGFKVWMDDYGSGSASPVIIQRVRFDLLKINVGLVSRIGSSDNTKIVITELVRMAMALGIETAAEGVEEKEQAEFLAEVGCSKMQGFYFCRPIPMEKVFARYKTGKQIGFENPEEAAYYSEVGRVSLYDLSFLSQEDDQFASYFDTIPMVITEANDEMIHFTRGNRNFKRFIENNFPNATEPYVYEFKKTKRGTGYYAFNAIRQCANDGKRRIIDDRTRDGKTVQLLIQRIAVNEITGMAALAIVILSVTERPKEENDLTYNYVARALAEDYIYLYFVDMKTGGYVEYNPDGKNRDLSVEKSGKNFFKQLRVDAKKTVYSADLESFLDAMTMENVAANLKDHGMFSITYRMYINMKPTYVNLKAVKVRSGEDRVIIGVNNVDAQMRRQETLERIKEERITYARITALSGDIISIYTVNPETNSYEMYKTSYMFQQLQLDSAGDDFFEDSLRQSTDVVFYEDLEGFKRVFTKKNVLAAIEKEGIFVYTYRICFEDDNPIYVMLKAALVEELDGTQLIVGLIDVDAQKRKELEYLKNLTVAENKANIDELTGVKNKNAYAEAENLLNEQIKTGKVKDYALVVCDMNGLKDVNDTLGHLAGDAFIKEGCMIICNAFAHSPVYRVGGDEFVVIAQGKDLSKLDALIEKIDKANEENKAKGHVTMAVGAAHGKEGLTVGDVFELADANMYIKKKRMKQGEV
ncbi:MAG: GGDEF domain-containing protein [Pseudobutyrivibrio sp.]|nr:GGDEF domain-containing protein [Pseudobutyrivibrio sp.]